MHTKPILTASAVALAAALALVGCSSGGGSSADAAASRAIMYSSNNETTVGVVTDAASGLDPSLKVDTVTGSTGPLLQRIESEKSKPAADVFYSAPASTFEEFADLIEPYEAKEVDEIPSELIGLFTNEGVVGV